MFAANPLNASSLAVPVLSTLHLIGMVCGVGSAAVVDLQLLGVGRSSPADVWKSTTAWIHGGLFLAITSGVLLFSLDPEVYYSNPEFHLKMTALVLAIGFYYTLVRRAAVRGERAVFTGLISLLLFAIVPLCGVLLGYE